MIKVLLVILLVLLLLLTFDISVGGVQHFEDGSGIVQINYCLVWKSCSRVSGEDVLPYPPVHKVFIPNITK